MNSKDNPSIIKLDKIEDAISDIKKGKIVIVVRDDCPKQLKVSMVYTGVIVRSLISFELLVLLVVKLGIVAPLPLAIKPISMFELVHI